MRFLLLLAASCLLAASTYLVCLFGAASYAEVERLGHIMYYEYNPVGGTCLRLALTPGRYALFRAGSGLLLGGSLLLALGLLRKLAYRRQLWRLGQETRRAGAALVRTGRRLSGLEWLGASALLLLILGARLFWFVNDTLSPDETMSYDTFVQEGRLAVTSFYPLPNNHVFYNFLASLLTPLLPGQVRLVMRLPSLLITTAGTALSYALLTHWRSFRVATLATALFSLAPAALVYAVAGRGYGVQLVCVQLAFFAAVGLLSAPAYHRLAWTVFSVSSIIGLYTVPTYASPLAALGAGLLAASWQCSPRWRQRFWGQLLLAGIIIGTTTIVLYTPVGCVSGWPRLLTNRYLAPHSLAAFGRTIPAYLYEAADLVLGPPRPALVGVAVVVGLMPLVLWHARRRGQMLWLAWLSWALLLGPLVLMPMQRVFMPARVLVYATYFLYLLATLGAAYVATWWRGRLAAWFPAGGLLVLLLFRIVEISSKLPALQHDRQVEDATDRAYHWLRTQPSGAVLIGAVDYEMAFHHYAMLDRRPLLMGSQRVAGVCYPYLVWGKNLPSRPNWAALPYRVAYEDAQVIIYQLAANPPCQASAGSGTSARQQSAIVISAASRNAGR